MRWKIPEANYQHSIVLRRFLGLKWLRVNEMAGDTELAILDIDTSDYLVAIKGGIGIGGMPTKAMCSDPEQRGWYRRFVNESSQSALVSRNWQKGVGGWYWRFVNDSGWSAGQVRR